LRLALNISRNVRLGWCRRRGYGIASCRATRSVSLLFRPTLYIAVNMVCYLRKRLKLSAAILVALIAHYIPNLASDGTVCNNDIYRQKSKFFQLN